MTGSSNINPSRGKPLGPNGYFSEEDKKKISNLIAKEALKVSRSIERSECETDASQAEPEIHAVQSLEQSVQSVEVSFIEEKRKGFIAKMVEKLKKIIKRVRNSKATAAFNNFTASLGARLEQIPRPHIAKISKIASKKEAVPKLEYGQEVISRCLVLLREIKAENEEGLFRISGRVKIRERVLSEFQKQKLLLPQDEDQTLFQKNFLLNKEEVLSAHDVAGGLKLVLGDLALLDAVKETLFEIGGAEDMTEGEKADALKSMLSHVDPVNLSILKELVLYLGKVAENSAVNKMTPANLAICIANNMYKGDALENPATAMANQAYAGEAVRLLIAHKDKIFSSP